MEKYYSSYINTPKVIRDSLCGTHNALEFNSETISLTTKSFIPDYAFDNGFSIFFVIKQNEEFSSDSSNINAMYPTGNIYKNSYLEIDWPSSLADSSSVRNYKGSYALNSLFYKNLVMPLDKNVDILSLYDVKGIDRSANHDVTTGLSAYSAGSNSASGFSKANFFEPDSYAILNVEYDGASTFNWYKNGVLKSTSEAVKSFYSKSETSTLSLGGHRDDRDYKRYLKEQVLLYERLLDLNSANQYFINGTERIAAEIAALNLKKADLPSSEAEKIAKLTAEIDKLEVILAEGEAQANKSLADSKQKLFDLVSSMTPSGFNGEISEVIVYSAPLSLDIRQRTEGYIAEKFCLENLLSSDHPYRYAPPSSGTEEEETTIEVKAEYEDVQRYNFTDTYIYTTDKNKDGIWKTSWLPLSSAIGSSSVYLDKASWNRTSNTLTLHRSGGADLTVDIDVFDTFVTEIFPITGELVPQFSSFVDSIFAYPTGQNDEQFSLAPAQKGFFDIIVFHSRSFPDLLWEKNLNGDTEIGGKYNGDTLDRSNFVNNSDLRKRSSYIWSGVVNKVGGSTSTIRTGKKYFSNNFGTENSFIPNASPIMVESCMDFNNGFKKTYLKSLNIDSMFTVSRGWSQGDFSNNIKTLTQLA